MPTKKEIKKKSAMLCFKSIAYCCKSGRGGKPCHPRDAFLESICMSQEDYEKYKKRCEELFFEMIKTK
jgi:predicted metal-binding transcription factor (methanogenesis marker protein 9)